MSATPLARGPAEPGREIDVSVPPPSGPPYSLTGLYKGILSKLIQSVLTAALLFASKERIYELTKKALTPVAVAAAQAS